MDYISTPDILLEFWIEYVNSGLLYVRYILINLELGYSTEEFQALQLIVLVVFVIVG